MEAVRMERIRHEILKQRALLWIQEAQARLVDADKSGNPVQCLEKLLAAQHALTYAIERIEGKW